MLVIVENRNGHPFPELSLDVEALRRLDVLEVYSPEGWLQARDDIDECIDIGLVDLDIEHVDSGELLEKYGFTLHDRLCRQWSDGAETEYRRAVADHTYQVAPRGQLGDLLGIRHDGVTGRRDARRVGESQILLGAQWLGGGDRQLAGHGISMVVEGAFVEFFCHDYFPGARRWYFRAQW